MSKIYDLQYDYRKGKENYLVIDREAGLLRDELHHIQTRMLETNVIPRILPIEIDETDLRIKLRYGVNTRVLLPVYIRSHPLTIYKFYDFLLEIISTIENSSLYMLSEENYILDSNFIYIGKDYDDIYLTYLPLKKINDKPSLQREFINLSKDLFRYIKEISGSKVNDLLNHIKQDDLSVSEIKKLLLVLMDKKSNVDSHIPEAYSFEETNKGYESDIAYKLSEKNVRKDLSNQQKNIVYILSFFVIALVWRFYLDFQLPGMLYLSIGLTILIADLAFAFTSLWRPVLSKKQKIKNHKKTSMKKTKNKKVNSLGAVKGAEYNQNNTTLLPRMEETVFLRQNTTHQSIQLKSNESNQTTAFLEINRASNKEKINITQDSFIIGRNPTAVDYVEDELEISKVHFELQLTDEEYGIRDLASKNGTFLNDNELVPNKVYPIKNGDVIKIAKHKYTFRVVDI